ncbi:hypothetical protein RFI_05675, partial [Reticulomyxa filosa]
MPEDSLSKIRRALSDSDSDTTSLTVLWCKNGHPFFVGERGYPTKQVVCATDGCGEVVGTLCDHDEKNIRRQQKDILQGYKKKKQLYQLDDSPEEHSIPDTFWRFEVNMQARYLERVTCTLLRFLIHLPLLLRDFGIAKGCVHLQKLLNKGSKQEVTDFLWRQAKGNFHLLCQITRLNEEQLAIALHFLLQDFGKWFNDTYPKGLFNVKDVKEMYTLEMNMDARYRTFFGNKKNGMKFEMQAKAEAKVKRKKSFNLKSKKKRCLVFMTWEDLAQSLNNDRTLKTKYPLLSLVLFSHELLWSVQYLTWIGQWLKRVYVRFCLKISSTEGCNKTIED